MDCDICSVCHCHIDYAAVDEAYPHLCEGADHFPPEGMSSLEEDIYWGTICVDCALAEVKKTSETFKNLVAVPPVKRK
jgi:hypothetical protein